MRSTLISRSATEYSQPSMERSGMLGKMSFLGSKVLKGRSKSQAANIALSGL